MNIEINADVLRRGDGDSTRDVLRRSASRSTNANGINASGSPRRKSRTGAVGRRSPASSARVLPRLRSTLGGRRTAR